MLFFVGCTKNTDLITPDNRPTDVAVAFDSYLQDSRTTRTTYPDAPVGEIDDDRLHTSAGGFGVFAQYTGNSKFEYGGEDTGGRPYNFMWNQQVTYDGTRWTYSPVKYWPNDNQPADDGDNDTGNNPAQGSQKHSYVSFFAYAPYRLVDTPSDGATPADGDDDGDDGGDDGIVGMTSNAKSAGKGTDKGTYVTYRTSNATPYDAASSVDLLWAAAPNRYKLDGYGSGYTTGSVDLVFKHALSKLTITVQGLFDHVDNDDKSPQYIDDRDVFTRILVESVDFDDSPLFSEGNMYLAPRPDDGSVPYWELNDEDADNDGIPDKRKGITVDDLTVNSDLANTYYDTSAGVVKKYWDDDDVDEGVSENLKSFLQLSDQNDDDKVDAADAKQLLDKLPKGVTHTEVPLRNEEDYYYMVLPNKGYIADHPTEKMKVHMVYYVITYDERLTLPKTGYPKYFSIVKNDVTATFDTFAFEANKKYKLRLQPGLTTVKFEVTVVDGWDTPITLNPEVVDWYTVTREYDVE